MHDLEIPLEAIDRIVVSAIKHQRIPGISIAIARAGKVVYGRGFGFRNVADQIEPDEDTIFTIASITKQFTAAMVMSLQEHGLVSLDDPITKFFPSLPYSKAVLVRHLLTHTSGIPGFTEVPNLDLRCYSYATPMDVVETVTSRQPAFLPGEQWQYSNTNYVILGLLIEKLLGESYRDALDRLIVSPLGLERTQVEDDSAIRLNEAEGYTAYALGEIEYSRAWHPVWRFATGALYSSATDLIRWNGGLRNHRIVNKDSFAQMCTPMLLQNGSSTNYGFGLHVDEVGGMLQLGHAGGLPGFHLENISYPELDLDIVVLANRDDVETYFSIIRRILALILNKPELAEWSAASFAVSAEVPEPPAPESWITAATSGRILELPIDDRFRRFLVPRRLRELERLADLGPLRSTSLIARGRRDPENSFTYRAVFEKQVLRAGISMTDQGKFRGIGFNEWHEPATS